MSCLIPIRRLFKWAGLSLTVAIFLAATLSLWWSCSYYRVDRSAPRQAADDFFVGAFPIAWGFEVSEGCIVLIRQAPRLALPGWRVRDVPRRRIDLLPQTGQMGHYLVPLWLPFLLVGLPTTFLWWFDRTKSQANAKRGVRRVLGWTGLVLTVLVPILWWVSLNWQLMWGCRLSGSQVLLLGVHGGYLFACLGSSSSDIGWSMRSNPFGPLWLEFTTGMPGFVMLPLWMPYCLVVGLTFWSLRRRTPNVPQCLTCSYNLTGNTSGVCPECGERI